MDTGRTHKTHGSETKDSLLLTALIVARVAALCAHFLAQFAKNQRKEAQKIPADVVGCNTGEQSQVKELRSLLYWSVIMPSVCSGGRHCNSPRL